VARRRPASPSSRLPEAARRVTCICALHPLLCNLSSDVSCKAGFAAGGTHRQQQQQRRPPSGTKQATPPSSLPALLPLLLSIPPPCPPAEHWSTFPGPSLHPAARSDNSCRRWGRHVSAAATRRLVSARSWVAPRFFGLHRHPPAAPALQNRPAGDQNSLVEFRPPAP
jgi:hypothetical protein